MDGPKTVPTRPEIPQPSSRTTELSESKEAPKKTFSGSASHSANTGVILHRTAGREPIFVPQMQTEGGSEHTSSGGSAGTVGSQNRWGLVDGEVPASDGDVQDGRLGVDEAKVLRGDVLGEEEKGFCSKRGQRWVPWLLGKKRKRRQLLSPSSGSSSGAPRRLNRRSMAVAVRLGGGSREAPSAVI